MKWLTFIAGRLLGGLQRYALPLAFVAGILVVAGIWWYMPSCKEKAALTLLEAEQEARSRAEELVTAHQTTISELRSRMTRLRRELNETVSDHPECDLSRGTVGMLNDARGALPEAAPLPVEEARAASTVTERAAILYWTDDIEQCLEWRDQLLQLIEWHDQG